MSRIVVFQDASLRYPADAPFHPSTDYPELARLPYPIRTGPRNPIYEAVREGLRWMGLDAARYGTPDWNPLSGIVRAGDRVVVKPNLVLHEPDSLIGSDALVTHGSFIRAMTDYVLLAAGPDARVTIGDCPLQEADLARLTRANGLDRVLDYYGSHADLPVEFVDFRTDRMVLHPDGRISDREKLRGDPRGNVTVRVDGFSELEPITRSESAFGAAYQQAFAVANYETTRTAAHHLPGHHEYLVPRSVLECDAFVNLAKLKTHQKAGITICQKNLIGINADKSYLPHYREGSGEEGGDEYPFRHWLTSLNKRVRGRLMYGNPLVWKVGSGLWRIAKAALLHRPVVGGQSRFAGNAGVSAGAWQGNDTLWRTILDINRILFFADAEGRLHDAVRRRYFAAVDGIVAGDRNGPILPRPRSEGVLLFGTDPLAIDVVATRLIGLDWTEIPQLRRAAAQTRHRYSSFTGDPAALDLASNDARWKNLFDQPEHLGFDPPPFWPNARLSASVAGDRK